MDAWKDFCVGELGAAAALAGLLFVSVSVNQARILELGRMADRALEAVVMLFLVICVASLVLVPGQPARWLGIETVVAFAVSLFVMVKLEHGYVSGLEAQYLPQTWQVVWLNRASVVLIGLAGAVLAWRNDPVGLYFLAPGVILSFYAVGANAWVLLVEINR